jgi:putative PIN family toxin of toxin-antitoxin system
MKMAATARLVFDCNVLLQALASPDGSAGRCFQSVLDGVFELFLSPAVLEELRDVTGRPKVAAKLRLTAARVERFLETLERVATIIDGFAMPFSYERDPDDAEYVNLALAAGATIVVTRDRDLLDLTERDDLAGADFKKRFPTLRILEPSSLLGEVDGAKDQSS